MADEPTQQNPQPTDRRVDVPAGTLEHALYWASALPTELRALAARCRALSAEDAAVWAALLEQRAARVEQSHRAGREIAVALEEVSRLQALVAELRAEAEISTALIDALASLVAAGVQREQADAVTISLQYVEDASDVPDATPQLGGTQIVLELDPSDLSDFLMLLRVR